MRGHAWVAGAAAAGAACAPCARTGPSSQHRVKKGTARRMLTFAVPYRKILAVFLPVVILDAVIGAVNPLILRALIDNGILKKDNGPGHRAGRPGRRPRPRRRRPRPHRAAHLRLHRREPDLRHALQGVPPHPAHAAGLLHPHPDRRPGQPAEQRRHRRPAGLHRPALQRGRQPRDRRHRPRRHVLPELADHPGRPHPRPDLPHPGPLRRPAHRLADQGGLQPQQRDEHGHAGALPGGRRHAGQADRAARGGGRVLRRQGRPGARHRHRPGHLRPGLPRLPHPDRVPGHRHRLRLRRRRRRGRRPPGRHRRRPDQLPDPPLPAR